MYVNYYDRYVKTEGENPTGKGERITTDVLIRNCESMNYHLEDIMGTIQDDKSRLWYSERNKVSMGVIITARKFSPQNQIGLFKTNCLLLLLYRRNGACRVDRY